MLEMCSRLNLAEALKLASVELVLVHFAAGGANVGLPLIYISEGLGKNTHFELTKIQLFRNKWFKTLRFF